MTGDNVRIRDQEGRPQQPDRPRGRPRASSRDVALGRRSASSSSPCRCSPPGSTSSCCATATASSRCRSERAAEEEINRHLRLEIETLRVARRGSSGWRQARCTWCAPAAGGCHRDRARASDGAAAAVRRRQPLTRAETEYPVADKPTHDWRSTLQAPPCRRRGDCCWRGRSPSRRGWSTCRSSQHDELTARAERQQIAHGQLAGQARRDPRPERPRARLQRRRRDDLCRCRARSTIRRRPPRVCAGRSATVRATERQTLIERLAPQGASSTSAARCRREQARRVAALKLEGVGFVKENHRFYPNKELAAHLLGYVGTRQRRPERHRERPTTR